MWPWVTRTPSIRREADGSRLRASRLRGTWNMPQSIRIRRSPYANSKQHPVTVWAPPWMAKVGELMDTPMLNYAAAEHRLGFSSAIGQALGIENHDGAAIWRRDDPFVAQAGDLPAHRFDGQPQEVGDVLAA